MGSGRKSVPRHQQGEIPFWAAPAWRYSWVCSGLFFLNVLEVSQQEPRDAAENWWPGENYCGLGGEINGVVQQQLADRKERECGQRDEWRVK